MYIYIHINIHQHIYIYIYLYKYISLYIYICICISIYVYQDIYIYIYIYTYYYYYFHYYYYLLLLLLLFIISIIIVIIIIVIIVIIIMIDMYNDHDAANQFEYLFCELETTATSFMEIIWMFQVMPVTSDGVGSEKWEIYIDLPDLVSINQWPFPSIFYWEYFRNIWWFTNLALAPSLFADRIMW